MNATSGENADLERLAALRPALEKRGAILHAIRAFFHTHGFLEVETPCRIPSPAPEEYIDAEPSGAFFLRTSPELHMKRLLAAGCDRIYQIGPCWRRGERGRLHQPEFTMLEWYRARADYNDILLDTRALVQSVAREVAGGTVVQYQGRTVDLGGPWERVPVSEAFLLHAGWDPAKTFDAARFDEDLVHKVEPALPKDVPVVLCDYPAACGALARRKPGRPEVAERWELYLGGMEIANAYSELADPVEQRTRFAESLRVRAARGREAYPPDEDFLQALAAMPAAGGIALGVDRLCMFFADTATLDDLLPFR